MTARQIELSIVGVASLTAVALAIALPAYPNYDSYYALVWARELLAGEAPSFEAYAAPTQHPLWILVAGALDVAFGSSADRAMVVVCSLALVATCWAMFRLAASIATKTIGVITAALVGCSSTFLLFVARGYLDLAFLALVAWAAALEVEQSRRGRVPMALLALAGLLRPEAWVLAGIYWIWCWAGGASNRRQKELLAAALTGPVIWAAIDFGVTGDPLFSLHSTSSLAEALDRPRGIEEVPGEFLGALADVVRPLTAIVGVGGGLLAWRWRSSLHGLGIIAVMLAAGTLTYVAFGIAGLSLLSRYLTVPALALTLLAAIAVGGWSLIQHEGGVAPRVLIAGFYVFSAAGTGALIMSGNIPGRVIEPVRYLNGAHDDLRRILDVPDVRDARRCGPVSLPNYRLVPDVRFLIDGGEQHVTSRSAAEARIRPTSGVALVAIGARNVRTIGSAGVLTARTNVAPVGFTEVARNRTFVAYARCVEQTVANQRGSRQPSTGSKPSDNELMQ